MPNRHYSNSNAYRYGFNGQEKDNEVSGEGNSNTAEFWQYDTRLGRRWNLDPKPNMSLSNYSCFANNPVYNLDIKGDTTWNFNSKTGAFFGLSDLKTAGNVGKLWDITEAIAKDGKKTLSCKLELTFVFNDIKLDKNETYNYNSVTQSTDKTTGILQKTMNAIAINANDIDGAMIGNGVKTAEAQNRPLTYIERESRPPGRESKLSGISSGSLDHYSTSPLVRTGALHIVVIPGSKCGIAYNDKDFGNFLWGHAGKILGFSFLTLSTAAHLNNAVNGAKDNPGISNIPLLDSQSDQRAIYFGTMYPAKE